MALLLGVLAALAAVALVLDPLVRPGAARPGQALFEDEEDDPLRHRKEQALAALKEIDFDHATGKLSDPDYELMKARYTAEALEAIRESDAAAVPEPLPVGAGSGGADAAEVLVAATRAAARSAGRRFCTECGAELEGSGRFCVACGEQVR